MLLGMEVITLELVLATKIWSVVQFPRALLVCRGLPNIIGIHADHPIIEAYLDNEEMINGPISLGHVWAHHGGISPSAILSTGLNLGLIKVASCCTPYNIIPYRIIIIIFIQD